MMSEQSLFHGRTIARYTPCLKMLNFDKLIRKYHDLAYTQHTCITSSPALLQPCCCLYTRRETRQSQLRTVCIDVIDRAGRTHLGPTYSSRRAEVAYYTLKGADTTKPWLEALGWH